MCFFFFCKHYISSINYYVYDNGKTDSLILYKNKITRIMCVLDIEDKVIADC